jgi:hypothetical protein
MHQVPERRATSSRTAEDVNSHEQEFSEKVMSTVWDLLSVLCPNAKIYRGPLNQRNVIPLKFIFSEPDKYGPLVAKLPRSPPTWQSIQDLADAVERPEVKSVMMDVFGSIGYFAELKSLAPSLGRKMKASNMPVIVMAGIEAELKPSTLAVPGRDPRATMNALYHKDGIRILLDVAADHRIPLLFITNSDCNESLKLEDADEVIKELGLDGVMADMARAWYGPHLKGKCVPFDWVSFFAMLCYERYPHLIKLEKRTLLVGVEDASILVLKDSSMSLTPEQEEIVKTNEQGTVVWGEVLSIVQANNRVEIQKAMLYLSKLICTKPESKSEPKPQPGFGKLILLISAAMALGGQAILLVKQLFRKKAPDAEARSIR